MSEGNPSNPDPILREIPQTLILFPGESPNPHPIPRTFPTCCMCPRTFFRQSKTPLPSSE